MESPRKEILLIKLLAKCSQPGPLLLTYEADRRLLFLDTSYITSS